jgi:hypothetical protein
MENAAVIDSTYRAYRRVRRLADPFQAVSSPIKLALLRERPLLRQRRGVHA